MGRRGSIIILHRALAIISASLSFLTAAQANPQNSVTERLLEVRLEDRSLISDGLLVIEIRGERYFPSEELLRLLGYYVETAADRGLLRAKISGTSFDLLLVAPECLIRWTNQETRQIPSTSCSELIGYESDIYIREKRFSEILGAQFKIDELKSLMMIEFEKDPPIIELRERERDSQLQSLVRKARTKDTELAPVTQSAGTVLPLQGPKAQQSVESVWRDGQQTWSLAGDYWMQVYGINAQYAYAWNSPSSLAQSWQLSKEDPSPEMGGLLGLSRVAVGDVYLPTLDLISNSRKVRGALLSSFSLDSSFEGRVRVFAGRTSPNWYVELFQNGVLVDAQRTNDLGEYLFSDVSLYPGANSIELRFFGTQGERSSERRVYFVSPENQSTRGFSYQAIWGQESEEDILLISQRTRLTDSLSLSTSAARFEELGNASKHYLQAQLKGSLRYLAWDLAGATDSGGQWASQLQTLGGWENARLRFRWQHGDGKFNSLQFPLNNTIALKNTYDTSLSFPVFRQPSVGLRLAWQHRSWVDERFDDTYTLSKTISYRNFFVQNDLKHTRPQNFWSGNLIAERSFSFWSLRTDSRYNEDRWEDSRLSTLVRSRDLKWTARAYYGENFRFKNSIWGLGGSHDLGWSRVLLNLENESSGARKAVASLELNLEKESRPHNFHLSSTSRMSTSSVSVRIFEDTNANGVWDEGEKALEGLRVLNNKSEWPVPSSSTGEIFLSPLSAHTDYRLEVHPLDLMKLNLKASSKVFAFRNMPGINRSLDIGLVKISEIEGYLTSRGVDTRLSPARFQNLRLQNMASGTSAIVRADREGYFLFDEVIAGEYQIFCEGQDEEPALQLSVDPAQNIYIQLETLVCPK